MAGDFVPDSRVDYFVCRPAADGGAAGLVFGLCAVGGAGLWQHRGRQPAGGIRPAVPGRWLGRHPRLLQTPSFDPGFGLYDRRQCRANPVS